MAARARWIHSARADVLVAGAWIPFAVAAHVAQGDRNAIGLVLSATFLVSFVHQPLTLPLVYGDPTERSERPTIYRWSPLVFVAAATLGLGVSVAAVAVIAGLWNAEHTLMQRFGITRIYGRKAGEADGRLERALLVSWLLLAAIAAAADAATEEHVARLPLGTVNRSGLDLLAGLRPVAQVLLPAVVIAAAVLTARWVRREARAWRARAGNPAKWVYVGGTALLIGLMVVDPVAGFAGYVGGHALEYFVIVHRSLGSRYADGSGGAVGRVVRAPGGRRRFFAGYALVMAALLGGLAWYGSDRLYLTAVLVLGGMHVLYDGFIWKLRKPSVARGLVTAQ